MKFLNDTTGYVVLNGVEEKSKIFYTSNGGKDWKKWEIDFVGGSPIIKKDTIFLLGSNLYVIDYKNNKAIKTIPLPDIVFDMRMNPVNGKILLTGYKDAEHGWSKFWRKKVVSVYELKDLELVKISGFTAGEKMFRKFLYTYGDFIVVSYSKYYEDFFVYSFDYGRTWHKNKIPWIYNESYDFYKDKEFYGTIWPRDFMAGKFYKDID